MLLLHLGQSNLSAACWNGGGFGTWEDHMQIRMGSSKLWASNLDISGTVAGLQVEISRNPKEWDVAMQMGKEREQDGTEQWRETKSLLLFGASFWICWLTYRLDPWLRWPENPSGRVRPHTRPEIFEDRIFRMRFELESWMVNFCFTSSPFERRPVKKNVKNWRKEDE
jgi:hypothetical protein